MSHDEKLVARIRAFLCDRDDVVEKKMFGGLCFMVNGAMCCGLTQTDFMLRVGPGRYDDALAACTAHGLHGPTAEGDGLRRARCEPRRRSRAGFL